MKYLIVGRSGCGKDYLATKLEEHGLNLLKSYATRPKRFPEENTHIFITPEQAANMTDKVATTVINGYEYFATRQQVENCDIYIIDPNGVKELSANMPDTSFHIIYVSTHDDLTREELALARAKDPDAEKKIFDKRLASEDAQFTEFEAIIQDENGCIADNCVAIHNYVNDYDENTAKMFAAHMAAELDLHRNLETIIDHCITLNILNSNSPTTVVAGYDDASNGVIRKDIPRDIFVDMLCAQPNGFNQIMISYLANPLVLRLPYDCEDCQREDGPCDTCIRNPENKDKPNCKDEYQHD